MMLLMMAFVAKDIHGNTVVLDSVLQKKAVILDFWATWCKHCDEELDKLKKHFSGREDVQIIAISQDTRRGLSKVKRMARAHRWNFLIILDEGKKISSRYGVIALPTVVVIGRDGEVRKKIVGFNPRLLELIEEALDK